MILYIDLVNHEHKNEDGVFAIKVDEVEYASCREILIDKTVHTRSYKFSRKVLLLEPEDEDQCVVIALTEEYADLAAKCEKIRLKGPKKTITINIKEEDMLMKKVVLGLGKN